MANETVGSIQIDMIARIAKLEAGMRRANKSLDGFGKKLEGLGRLSKKIGLAIGGYLSMRAVVRGLGNAMDSVDRLAKTSDKLGIATENLAGLRHAAATTGVQINTLDMGIQRMTRRISEAARGAGEAKDALRELGLNAREMQALSPDQQFRRIADAMNGVGSQSDRVRLAMRLFDTEGVALVNTLKLGTDGLDKMQDEANKLGLSISRIDAAKVEAANDSFNRLQSAISGMLQRLAVELSPAFAALSDMIVDATKSSDGLKDSTSTVVVTLLEGAEWVLSAWEKVLSIFRHLRLWGAYIGRDIAGLLDPGPWKYFGNVVAEKFGNVFDLLANSAKSVGVWFGTIPEQFTLGFAKAIQAVNGWISDMLVSTGQAMMRIKGMGEAGEEVVLMAGRMRQATAAITVKPLENYNTAMTDLGKAQQDVANSWDALWGTPKSKLVYENTEYIKAYNDEIARLEAMLASGGDREGLAEEFVRRMKEFQDQIAAQATAGAGGPGMFTSIWSQIKEEIRVAQDESKMMVKEFGVEVNSIWGQAWAEGQAERLKMTQWHWSQQTKTIFGELEQTTRGVAQHNKTMFEINKVAGIANAVVNTAEGVTKTLAKYPGPIGIALAAVHAAAGIAQINAIRSTQFGGGGGAAPSVSGSGGGLPAEQGPDTNQAAPNAGQSPGGATLVFPADGLVSARQVADYMQQAIEDGHRITRVVALRNT